MDTQNKKTPGFKPSSAYKLLFQGYPDVVNASQMCQMLGINIKSGYELLKTGQIKSFMIGHCYRIPKLFILEYMGVLEQGN